MEPFVHLRKGTTPRRLHADLDGLKDDELGRGGFTGRTANMYRRHDPTAYRSSGPLRPIDVLTGELKPGDSTDPAGTPMLLFSNPDCRISLSRRTEEMPFFVRHVDGDLLCFVHRGSGLLETEFGPLRYNEGDWVYLPKATTWRQLPTTHTTLLMIEVADEFTVPPAGQLGRHFPFDPSQATIPEPAPIDDDGRDEYEVRLVHEGGPTSLFYRHNPIDVEGWRGGGSLSVFDQQQARHPTITASPSGDGPDLTALGPQQADAIMLPAAHVSRHVTLTEWMDASILDESDPTKRDPQLDLYHPGNSDQPPSRAEFLARYRQAQIDRNRRITAWVKDKLADLKAGGVPMTSSLSSCTAPWPIRGGSTPPSIRTNGHREPATWVTLEW